MGQSSSRASLPPKTEIFGSRSSAMVTDSGLLREGQFSIRISERVLMDLLKTAGAVTRAAEADETAEESRERRLVEEGYRLGIAAMQRWKALEADRMGHQALQERERVSREVEEFRSQAAQQSIDAFERRSSLTARYVPKCQDEKHAVSSCYRQHGSTSLHECVAAVSVLASCADKFRHGAVQTSVAP